MKKLVIYYSLQGHTKKVAEIIAKKLGGDLERINPIKDYNLATSAVLGRRHIKNGYMPEIKPINKDLNDYDEIIIGTPVWWYTFVPHIRTFLNYYDFSGKKIKLFCTHGGGPGTTISDMKNMIGDAVFTGQQDYFMSLTGSTTIDPELI